MSYVLGVTGHRPNKLGGYTVDGFRNLVRLARRRLAARPRPEKVITGMALGWDQAVAMACIDLGLPYLAAVPFRGQESRWPKRSRDGYNYLLELASEVVVVDAGSYAAWKLQKRNEYIVDHCDELLALWNGTPGGTGNCVAYANRTGRKVTNCWADYEENEWTLRNDTRR